MILLGDLAREFGGRLVTDNLLNSGGVPPNFLAEYPRFALNRATSPPPGVIVGELVQGLAGCDDDEQSPEVVAVAEFGNRPRAIP